MRISQDSPPAAQTALQLISPTAFALDSDFAPLSMALLEILRHRASRRAFSPRELPLYTLSRLLWAADGINRPGPDKRTAPSANDRQAVDLYVAMAGGVYLFDAQQFLLQPVLGRDVRKATGEQDFVATAPVNLIYVARLERDSAASRVEQKFYAALDTGAISQNVYLFCAAEGMATVVRGWVDRPALARLLGLGPDQRIIAAQSVGYPAEQDSGGAAG
jgi:nitroreductase